MKKIFLSIFATLMLCGCATKSTELKVLSWNIWHGGHGESLPKDGLSDVVEIIRHSDADIIFMIETYGSSDSIASALGFEHRLLSDNLSIYSRYPIVNQMTYPDTISTFNFGGVEIDVNGTKVVLFDTWLNYIPDCRLVPDTVTESEIVEWENGGGRVDEINAALKAMSRYIADADKVPVIVAGDFNGHSHLDWTAQTAALYNHLGLTVDWPVSRAMTKAGFIDSFRQIHPDPAKNIGATWLSGASAIDSTTLYGRQDRIDFIYYIGSKLKAVESQTVNYAEGDSFDYNGKQFMFPSDHGFVLTTFSLAK